MVFVGKRYNAEGWLGHEQTEREVDVREIVCSGK